jgi:Uma2 family endonuclease
MATVPIRTKRWTRLEYERLVDLGALGPDDRIELVGGDLLVREPQGSPHMTAIGLAEDALRAAFGAGWHVRTQGPIALDDESEPEPDVAVVSGSRRHYAVSHPTQPALLVEVADSSLASDRERKGSLYARARVPEYWIVNLVDRALEVHRDPRPALEAAFGWHYARILRLSSGETVTPLGAPGVCIAVADLLP